MLAEHASDVGSGLGMNLSLSQCSRRRARPCGFETGIKQGRCPLPWSDRRANRRAIWCRTAIVAARHLNRASSSAACKYFLRMQAARLRLPRATAAWPRAGRRPLPITITPNPDAEIARGPQWPPPARLGVRTGACARGHGGVRARAVAVKGERRVRGQGDMEVGDMGRGLRD